MAELKDLNMEALDEVFGSEGTQIIQVIEKPMEDKEISQRLNFETSKVRTILNGLLEKNLVQLYRDRLDTGYCHYNWVRREDKIVDYVNYKMDKRIRKLDMQMIGEDDIMFECGCKRVDYGKAIEDGFACKDCGKQLNQIEAGKGSRKIKAEIRRLSGLKSAS